MKAAPRTPTELFSAPVRYLVPLFQRPYVWDKEHQWEPLWSDVANLAEAALATPDSKVGVPPHFLGAVVVEQQRGQVGYIPVWHIIDGQQRFTTLQLLIDAVQEVVDELGDPKDSKALRSLVLNDPDLTVDDDDQFKVWPTDRDQNSFRAAMTDGIVLTGAMASMPIGKAHGYFRTAARAWALEDEPAADETRHRLHALVVCLRTHMRVVAIELDDGDNAQVIFESLNYRGSPLLAADLIKNLVFQRAKVQGLDVAKLYAHYWRELDSDRWRKEATQGRLKRPRIDIFMNHWLVMKLQREVPSDRIYAEFRDHIAASDVPVEALMAELARDANTYEAFELRPPTSLEGEFYYRVIKTLDSSVIMPVVLWLLRWPEAELPPAQRVKAFNAIESWLVRRALLRLTTKDLNRATFDLLARLEAAGPESAGDLIQAYLLAQASVSRLWPDEASVISEMARSPIYNALRSDRIRLILEALEDSIRSNTMGEGTACPRNLTVEHVMPQTWRENWPLADTDPEAQRERDRRVQTLGNLTLVAGGLNSGLSNRAWRTQDQPGKRDYLMDHSELKLNAKLVAEHQESWDDAAIESRTIDLAQRVVSIWPRPEGGAATQELLEALRAQPTPATHDPSLMERGAATLTREQRDPESWLSGLADRKGYGSEFRQIVEAARSFGLNVRFQNMWWVASITPLGKGNTGLIWLESNLSVSWDVERIAQYVGCSPDRVREEFGEDGKGRIDPAEVDDWIDRFRGLFASRRPDNLSVLPDLIGDGH